MANENKQNKVHPRYDSPLRLGATCYAQGIIKQKEYRNYRTRFLNALVTDQPHPSIPTHWYCSTPPSIESEASSEITANPSKSWLTKILIAIVILLIALLVTAVTSFAATKTAASGQPSLDYKISVDTTQITTK